MLYVITILFRFQGFFCSFRRLIKLCWRNSLQFQRARHHHQHAFRGPKCKVGALKLDSRFIQDVNIFDGTVMAPSTPFTKIWRMRNNGTLLWPAKTQLVWIGGDKLSNSLSVEVQASDLH